MKKEKVLIYIETTYSLLLTLIFLLSEQKIELENIIYFYSKEQVSMNRIAKKFNAKIKRNNIEDSKNIKLIIKKIINNFKLIKELNQKEIKKVFIQDHIKESQFLLNNIKKDIYLIEDGTRSYNEKILKNQLETRKNKEEYSRMIKLKIWLYKNFIEMLPQKYLIYGMSEKIKKIYLTGILPIPDIIKDKVELINVEKLWKELSKEKKRKVLEIFDIELKELEKLKEVKDKILLLTQPLSEDGIVDEIEKIEMYKQLLYERGIKKIYIKPHPREKTDYREVFKNTNIEVKILSNKFPAEIFMLLDMNFKKVITIFSTAALNFKYKCEVEFIGTEKYSKLYELFGKISIEE